jgi:hypothetical protein
VKKACNRQVREVIARRAKKQQTQLCALRGISLRPLQLRSFSVARAATIVFENEFHFLKDYFHTQAAPGSTIAPSDDPNHHPRLEMRL